MVKFVRVLLMISGLVIMQGAPLYADDSRQEETVSAEEALKSWQQRELERTRKLVQIIKRVKNDASCDLGIAAIRKLYMNAQQDAYLDPCPDKDFSYDQLGSRERRPFDKLVKQLRKELLRVYTVDGSWPMAEGLSANSWSPSKPRRRTKSRKEPKISSKKLETLNDLILEFSFVRDAVFPLES